jgi:hypothetical protein
MATAEKDELDDEMEDIPMMIDGHIASTTDPNQMHTTVNPSQLLQQPSMPTTSQATISPISQTPTAAQFPSPSVLPGNSQPSASQNSQSQVRIPDRVFI